MDMVSNSEDMGHNTDETPETYARGQHPNSLGALEDYKWTPGISGNPGGRPKRSKILQEAFKNKLESIIEDGDDKGKKIAEAISDMAWKFLKRCKTPSEFSSILSQIRETAGERAMQKEDMPAGRNIPINVVILPAKQPVEIQAAAVVDENTEEEVD